MSHTNMFSWLLSTVIKHCVSGNVSRRAKRDLLGVKIENSFLAYVNSFIFPESDYV